MPKESTSCSSSSAQFIVSSSPIMNDLHCNSFLSIQKWPKSMDGQTLKSRKKIIRSEAFDRETKGEGGKSSFRKGWGGEAKCRPGPWTLSKWREWPAVDLIGGGMGCELGNGQPNSQKEKGGKWEILKAFSKIIFFRYFLDILEFIHFIRPSIRMTTHFAILFTFFALTFRPGVSPPVPSLISTYTLNKGEEEVRVKKVRVQQVMQQEFGQVLLECGPGDKGFYTGGKNYFKLNWMKCPILNGIDTIKLLIYYKKGGLPKKRQATQQVNVEYHNQEMIKTEYTIDMDLHRDKPRRIVPDQQPNRQEDAKLGENRKIGGEENAKEQRKEEEEKKQEGTAKTMPETVSQVEGVKRVPEEVVGTVPVEEVKTVAEVMETEKGPVMKPEVPMTKPEVPVTETEGKMIGVEENGEQKMGENKTKKEDEKDENIKDNMQKETVQTRKDEVVQLQVEEPKPEDSQNKKEDVQLQNPLGNTETQNGINVDGQNSTSNLIDGNGNAHGKTGTL